MLEGENEFGWLKINMMGEENDINILWGKIISRSSCIEFGRETDLQLDENTQYI